MEPISTAAAFAGMLAGSSWTASRVLVDRADKALLTRVAHVCYRHLEHGAPIFLDDLQQVYTAEAERLVGIPAKLNDQESHEVTARLGELCRQHPPSGDRTSSWKG